ncbi:cytochrome P450 [Endogone sp. FLAS-F59071]|nr:cytochrome P450 [Endogone sp. FLAS-F59071]|eukprot:RUS22954.1 cytochrome P450 [Endogone sp. FLAS-F59071]
MWNFALLPHFSNDLATFDVSLLLTAAIVGPISYAVYHLYLSSYYFSPLRYMPGEKPSWNGAGSAKEMMASEYRYYNLWNKPIVAVNDPKLIQQILVTSSYDYIKGSGQEHLERVIGKGLVLGDQHKYQRKAINPAFAHKHVKTMVPTFFRLAARLSERWRQQLKPDGKATEFPEVMEDLSKVTLDIIGLAGFGENFDSLSSDFSHSSPIHETYMVFTKPQPKQEFWKMVALSVPYMLLPWDIFVQVADKRIQEVARAIKRIRELTWELVQRKKSESLEEEKKGEVIDKEKEMNLLGILLKMSREGDGLTDKELQAQVMTFLAAGHDTTTMSLTWGLWLLARHPETQRKLREEVTPLFKDALDNGKIPSYDDIDALKYLNAVCKEEMRLIPAVPATTRQPIEDVELGGYLVPKGTTIVIPMIVIHRLPGIWGEDSEEFKPERWFEKPATEISPHEYLPFLVGPRHCIGYKFALMEMKVILGILITQFEFAEVPGFQVLRKANVTCKPSAGMKLLVREV